MISTGIKTNQECVAAFESLKMKKDARYLSYRINKDEVILDFVGPRATDYSEFLKSLPKDQARYIVYDFPYKTKDNPPRDVEKIIFIYWCPDDCVAKERMVSATTKEDFKKNLSGIAREIQAKDFSDVEYEELVKILS